MQEQQTYVEELRAQYKRFTLEERVASYLEPLKAIEKLLDEKKTKKEEIVNPLDKGVKEAYQTYNEFNRALSKEKEKYKEEKEYKELKKEYVTKVKEVKDQMNFIEKLIDVSYDSQKSDVVKEFRKHVYALLFKHGIEPGAPKIKSKKSEKLTPPPSPPPRKRVSSVPDAPLSSPRKGFFKKFQIKQSQGRKASVYNIGSGLKISRK